MEKKSTRERCTKYEVYNRRTGHPVTTKNNGRPVRTHSMKAAMMFVNAFREDDDVLHHAVVDRHHIPADAELGVRPVRVIIYGRKVTLSGALTELGYTHDPCGGTAGKHNIIKHGKVVFTGDCLDTWAWLRRTGQVIDAHQDEVPR